MTFYAPDVILKDLDLQLTAAEQNIYDDIMATETLQHLEAELGAVGNGLVWQKDHFEMIANRGTAHAKIYWPIISNFTKICTQHYFKFNQKLYLT